MKGKFLLLICVLFFNTLFAQKASKSLEARVSVIHENEHGRVGPLMAIGVSFINKSNKDIYIPQIVKFSNGQSHFLLNVYKKDGSDYLPFSYSKAYKLKMAPGNGFLGAVIASDINRQNKQINDKVSMAVKNYIEEHKLEVDTGLFTERNTALFLKAGEERQYFFTIELLGSVYTEGEYIFVFEPDFSKSIGKGYPKAIMGYKKLIPTAVESNSLYLNLKKVNRGK